MTAGLVHTSREKSPHDYRFTKHRMYLVWLLKSLGEPRERLIVTRERRKENEEMCRMCVRLCRIIYDPSGVRRKVWGVGEELQYFMCQPVACDSNIKRVKTENKPKEQPELSSSPALLSLQQFFFFFFFF